MSSTSSTAAGPRAIVAQSQRNLRCEILSTESAKALELDSVSARFEDVQQRFSVREAQRAGRRTKPNVSEGELEEEVV